jgi:arylsulfatase A-like enzyme
VAFLTQPFVRQKLGPTAVKASWKLDADAFQASVRNAHLTSDRPVVQYRHYFATHQPILYDKDCRVTDELNVQSNQSLAGAEGEVTCVLTRFGEFVDKLKQLGVYDRTMLFLVSDHGYETNINASKEPLAREFLFPGSATLGPMNIKPAGAYNPSLFFKDFGQRGPLREVGAPASLIDVSATVCAAMDGCGFPVEGRSLKDPIPNDRVRRYWRYFGGGDTRFEGGEDRLHRGMGKWWERRSFTGTIPAGLVPSLAQAPAGAGQAEVLTK